MITQQLDLLWPRRQAHSLEKLAYRKYRLARRLALRRARQTWRFICSQYYLTSALADGHKALALNEDIVLANLIIIGVMSFSTISILANAIFIFVLAADAMSTISGINGFLLMSVAMIAMSVYLAWIAAFVQNSLSISLMEGMTRKQKRSLRLTLRKGLRNASLTVGAWVALLAVTFGPVIGLVLIVGSVAHIAHLQPTEMLPFLIGLGAISFAWVSWILINYTLVPYVALFEKTTDWRDTFARSQRLVQRKGRLFLSSGYLAFLASLAGLYSVAHVVQQVFHFNSTLMFLLLSTIAVSVANAVLTMFYRKRKLARK